MRDLRTLLDQAAGNPPDLPDLAAIRERGQSLKNRNRLGWGVAAAAAAVVVLAAGAAAALQDSHRETMPAPQPSQSQARPPVINACPVQTTPPRDAIAYAKTRSDGTRAVHLMAPDGSGDRCLVDTAGPDTWVRWSPDGQWLAFVGGDAGQEDLFVVRADGSDLTRITDTSDTESQPNWSPDGSQLGYTASPAENGPPSIHVVRRDGRQDATLLIGSEWVGLQDWSPDGRTLLYARDDSTEGGHMALWTMSPNGTSHRLLRSEEGDFGSGARYSPDGSQLAFQDDLDGGCVYLSDSRARTLTKLMTGCSQGGSLSWSPDGKRIVTAGGAHGPRDVVVMTADGGEKRAITTQPDAAYADWQPSITR